MVGDNYFAALKAANPPPIKIPVIAVAVAASINPKYCAPATTAITKAAIYVLYPSNILIIS